MLQIPETPLIVVSETATIVSRFLMNNEFHNCELSGAENGFVGEMETARMIVYIGNGDARDFESLSEPFPAKERAAQLWDSLFVKNADTVIAVSETSISGQPGIWSVEGKLARQ